MEVLVPLNQYIPFADDIPDDVRPVLLKLDVSIKDGIRLLAARHIELKQQKNGRFNLRAPVERIEGDVEETVVPTEFERRSGNVYRIITAEPLVAGEYALLFRKKALSGH